MGENQFPVSIDKSYKTLAKEIMGADKTYQNLRTGKPNFKMLCENGIRLIHLFKTGKIKLVLVGCSKESPIDREIEIVKKILMGEA